jgi:hypothetical protein
MGMIPRMLLGKRLQSLVVELEGHLVMAKKKREGKIAVLGMPRTYIGLVLGGTRRY